MPPSRRPTTRSRCSPAAVELIDGKILELSRRKLEFRRLASALEGEPEALLFVTFFADTPAAAGEQLDRLEAAWREHGHGYHVLRAETAAEQDALTKVRKSGLGLLMAASSGARRPLAFVEDTAVAPERLGDYVAPLRARSSSATGSMPASTATARSAACTSARSST